MSFKYLNNFIRFDFKAFSQNKQFKLKEVSEWEEYETKKILGTKISLNIIDDSVYQTKDGEKVGANDMETLVVKVRQPLEKFSGWERRDKIEFVAVEKASVYGEYQNQLSVIADVYDVSHPEVNYIQK